jgi:Ca2+-binding RTX toxin-like protein
MAIVKGAGGADWIDASDGVTDDKDIIWGFDGNDTILGLGGDDIINGNNGNDVLKGGGGADSLYGGTGFDTASYSDSPTGVKIYLDLGIVQGGTAQGDTLHSIENLTGSNYQDHLSGDDGNNVLTGLDGGDYLFGNGGADTLNGGNGNDSFDGGAGADIFYGGSGDAVVQYATSPTGVFVSLQSGKGESGDAEGDQLNSIEGITGSEYGDILWGDDGDYNFLEGCGGADILYGYGGADYIYGGDGDDWIRGMDGIDFLSGNNGADHIHGGFGADTLWGNSGADIFLWSSAAEAEYDLANLACTTDHICDFNHAEGDVIDLSEIDAKENLPGDQFTFIGPAAFSGNPGEINYFYDGGNTYIQLQTNASPEVEGMIQLLGIHTPQASWFNL